MATSSFTRKIILEEKAVDKLIEILSSEDETAEHTVPEYDMNNKEFMEKCLGLSICRK